MKILFSSLLLLITVTASADFLIVQRNGNLRAQPSTNSEVLERIHTGDTLILIESDAKLNGTRTLEQIKELYPQAQLLN